MSYIQRFQQEVMAKLKEDRVSGAQQVTLKIIEDAMEMVRLAHHRSPEEFQQIMISFAKEVLKIQPTMAPLINLCNDICLTVENDPTPDVIKKTLAVHKVQLKEHFQPAIKKCAERLPKTGTIFTYSMSSSVLATLLAASKSGKKHHVVVSESRPSNEGITMARELARAKIPVTVTSDMGLLNRLHEANCVIVGADAVTQKGVWNKIGTGALARLARDLKIPFYCVVTSDKFLSPGLDDLLKIHDADPKEIWKSPNPYATVENRYYEEVPLKFFGKIFSEQGAHTPQGIKTKIKKKNLSQALTSN
ncbi:hypothetical protein KKA47_02905 [bacterium]|nr:hypothetical protein [bacterium]